MRLLIAVATLASALAASAQSPAGSPADRGAQFIREGKFEEAAGVLVPAASAQRKDARLNALAGQALLEFGAAARREGNQDEAEKRTKDGVKFLELAIAVDPKNGETHRWVGIGYGRQAMTANKFRQAMLATKAKSAFETAVKLDSTDVAARQALMEYYLQAPGIVGGSVEKAKEQARIIGRMDRLRGYFALAAIHLRQKDTTAAIEQYRDAARAFPDSVPPNTTLAAVLANTGRYPETWQQVELMVQRWPNDPRVVFAIGRAAAVTGQQLDRGATALRSYLSGKGSTELPTSAAHYRLGMILRRQGDLAGARSEFETVVRLDPRHRDAKTALDSLKGK